MKIPPSTEIQAFLDKWEGRVTDEPSFADDCSSLGFEMDSGRALTATFPDQNITSSAGLQAVINEITDIQFLGTAIFSYWRYCTHWGSGITDEAQQWLQIAFTRMRELAVAMPPRQ